MPALRDRPSECLSPQQVEFYQRNGYLVLEARIPEPIIAECHQELERFFEMARGITHSDGRLDLEASHTMHCPRVRRVKLPHTQSRVFESLMRSDWILAPARDLIGPDLRLHTSKLNVKAAGYGSPVDWHQDFAFYPHTNDDVLAVGVMLDAMTTDNGPLMIFPGSHRGAVLDHHSRGVFSGTIDLRANGLDPADAVKLTAPAGSISLHHARVIHGSDTNRSAHDRSVVFYEITAADAFPIMGAMVEFSTLEEYDRKLLCGRGTIEPRVEPVPVRIPLPQPKAHGSIFEVQESSAVRGFDT